MPNESISDDAIFKIGRVISVDGRVVRVKVDKRKNSSHLVFKGELLKNVAVGGYIKIMKGFTSIIGKVDGESISEDKPFSDKEYGSERERINRTLNVRLLGFLDGTKFERGIKELPLLDNECYLLSNDEFDRIHDFIKRDDEPLEIGTLALEKGQTIRVGVNGLFASHIGIFGNTGSGKSYTLAKIYRELFLKYKDSPKFQRTAQFFLIDFNGEYIDDDVIIDKKYKRIYKLSTKTAAGGDKFPISAEALNSGAFWSIFLEATEKTQTPFLRRAVENDYLIERTANPDTLKALIAEKIVAATTHVDRNSDRRVVIDFLTELRSCLNDNASITALLEDYRLNLRFHNTNITFYYVDGGTDIYSADPRFAANCINAKVNALDINVAALTSIDAIRLRVVIQYYDDIIRGFSNKEHLSPLIGRFAKRKDDLAKVISVPTAARARSTGNLTVVSLKDVNLHIRKFLPLLLCKNLYDEKKKEGDSGSYFNLIIDEAHNILSEDSDRESEQWKDYRLETFEEIIKEGRKFGVFVTIASQRPSDISPTIVSQLHNYFLHRLINNEDIKAVEKTISYLDKVSFESLPILPTGTCILAGLLANVPVVVDIGSIRPEKYEPTNKTMTLNDKWKK